MAQPNGGSSTKSQNGTYDRNHNSDRDDRRTSSEGSSRQAAIERLKVTRGISPERTLSSSQSYSGTKILKKPPVKRSSAPKSVFPNFRIPAKNVNHVRDAGLKALRDGPIALNKEKRDRRSVEEVTAELREKDARREERANKMKAIEEEREKQRLHREKAFQAAKYQRALMSDDVHETERLHKEITGESKAPRKGRSKRAGSPRASGRSRGPFEEDLSVSSVIAGLFGTRYRARAEDEDLSDDMEARPDEVFREEARSARIARQEDEKEAELERAQAERARKRKLEREKERSRS
ncbi:hypothetical protein BGZ72_007248 [Mortierella alpina]|nr:hypothetical protein BGZ72_007248 [Mortierella alpina]